MRLGAADLDIFDADSDDDARAEVESLREAVSFLPPRDVSAPASLWAGIEGALEVPAGDLTAPPLRLLGAEVPAPPQSERGSRRGRRAVALLAAAAIVLAVVLGVQVVRQQDRIDDLAAEMHRDPMQQQALAARGADDAHVIALDAMHGDVIAPPEHVIHLRQGLAEHFGADVFLKCESMAALVRENMRQIRLEDTTGRVRVSPA